jgi:adenosine deaminase
MEYEDYLRRLPKAELHCHLEGSVRAETFVELARKNGVELPTSDPGRLYQYDNIYDFLEIYRLVSLSLVDREDFARAAYESLEDGAKKGNLKYREMFFNPTNHYAHGVSYATMIDGLIDGIAAAEDDLGVICRLVPSINRQESPKVAVEMVRDVVSDRRDEVVGIGMDHAEALGPPENFVEAYRLAGENGLHRTAHACEDAPPQNVETCLDLLGCERIDHGYLVLDDLDLTRRARDEGVVFTACLISTAQVYGWRDLPTHPIKGMLEAGLRLTINSDDPPMFDTDVGHELITLCASMDLGPEKARELCLTGVDDAWLDDSDKARLRKQFEAEIAELDELLDGGGAAARGAA